jgi:hypothetical protein
MRPARYPGRPLTKAGARLCRAGGLAGQGSEGERWFLNLRGFHGGAYVMAFVEDTSEC